MVQRRVPIIWLAAVVSAVLIGGWIWYSQTPQRVVARRVQQLDSLEGEQIPAAVQDLVRLGQPGVAATVGLLRKDQPEVRDAAKDSLRQELTRWRMIEPYESTDRVRHLADTLKAQIDQFAPPERDFAAEMATEILLWPLQGDTPERLEIVRDCETILRKSYEGRSQVESYAARDAQYDQLLDRLAADRLANGLASSAGEVTTPEPNSPGFLPMENLPEGVAYLADSPRPTMDGDNLPPVRVDVDRRLNELGGSNSPSPNGAGRSLARPTIPREIDGSLESSSSNPTDDSPVARLAPPPGRDIRDVETSPSLNITDRTQPPTLSHAERERYRWWAHVDLMRHLHNQDREFADRCREELENRGFTPSQIAVSFEVTDPDPAVRRAVVDKLSRHATFDPKPWMKLLCEDENWEVRAAAISFLATSTNPDDRRYVARLMEFEHNAALREQLQWR